MDLAIVTLKSRDRPHCEGSSYYSYRTNTIWLNADHDSIDFSNIATHELSHYYMHKSTPYGFFLGRLARVCDDLVFDYCSDFLALLGRQKILYPIYQFACSVNQGKGLPPHLDKLVIKRLIEQYIKPWSHFEHLLDLMEGDVWGCLSDSVQATEAFVNLSVPFGADFLLELENLEALIFPIQQENKKTNVGESAGFARLQTVKNIPACPIVTDCSGGTKRLSAFGGHHIVEALAQSLEHQPYITKEITARNPDYWLLWLALVTTFQPIQASRETLHKLQITFLALCDLSLFTPIGALYGVLRTEAMDWSDIHPGHRFQRLLQVVKEIGFLTELSSKTLMGYQNLFCQRLGWPSPRKFVELGMFLEGDGELEYEHRRACMKRFADHGLYLRFMMDQMTREEINEELPFVYFPLIKPGRGRELLVVQHRFDVSEALRQMVGFFLPQWTEAVMKNRRLSYKNFLPEELTITEPATGKIWSQNQLIDLIADSIPILQPANFVRFQTAR
jgi:hypothetical protein